MVRVVTPTSKRQTVEKRRKAKAKYKKKKQQNKTAAETRYKQSHEANLKQTNKYRRDTCTTGHTHTHTIACNYVCMCMWVGIW